MEVRYFFDTILHVRGKCVVCAQKLFSATGSVKLFTPAALFLLST